MKNEIKIMCKKLFIRTIYFFIMLAQIQGVCQEKQNKTKTKALTIVSYGGSYSKTQQKYIINPYIKKSGIQILFENYNGGIEELKMQVKAGNVNWDVMDIDFIDLEHACKKGLLEKLDHDKIIVSNNPSVSAREDFLPEALSNKCGIGTIIWSIVMAYNQNTFSENIKPSTIQDFFDLKKFPGKRALKKRPQVNLEWALIADGVAKDKVYEVLKTEDGVNQAFKKLNTIKKHTIWFDSWSQSPQLLASQDAKIVQSPNGRIYYSIKNNKQPFKIIWDSNSYDLASWAIPKGTKKKKVPTATLR